MKQVVADMQLPNKIVETPHGDGPRTEVEYRLAWARTYLKWFGLVENSERGIWSLTTEGAQRTSVDPREVIRLAQERFRRPPRAHPRTPGPETLFADTPGESIDETAQWRSDLLSVILKLSPEGFERLCQRILRESGFVDAEVSGRSGDGGIDGRGIVRIGGLISSPVLFQAKRYQGSVGPSIIRDFRGALIGRADKGVIITTGAFTQEAWREETRDGAPPIDLIDGD